MRLTLSAAGAFGATALLLKAYGQHGLPPETGAAAAHAFAIATDLQLLHGVLLIACGWMRPHFPRLLPIFSAVVLAGTALFCLPIYATTLLGAPRWIHMVTPLGGVLLIAGWTSLVVLPWLPRETGGEE